MEQHVEPCPTGFACMICGRTISRPENMRRHMRETHMKPRLFRCPPCDKVFVNRTFYDHVVKVHPGWKGMKLSKFRTE